MTEIRKFTPEERASFGYTVAELREIARERQVHVPSRALHHEIVTALKDAGVDLPMKPPERAYPLKPGAPIERIVRKPLNRRWPRTTGEAIVTEEPGK